MKQAISGVLEIAGITGLVTALYIWAGGLPTLAAVAALALAVGFLLGRR